MLISHRFGSMMKSGILWWSSLTAVRTCCAGTPCCCWSLSWFSAFNFMKNTKYACTWLTWYRQLSCHTRDACARLETGLYARAVLTCLGALGPPGWWGPYHPYGPRGGVGAIVLCTSEASNIHLGPNQGQTWCQITIYEMGLNLL